MLFIKLLISLMQTLMSNSIRMAKGILENQIDSY